jgi:hypothetical protein
MSDFSLLRLSDFETILSRRSDIKLDAFSSRVSNQLRLDLPDHSKGDLPGSSQGPGGGHYGPRASRDDARRASASIVGLEQMLGYIELGATPAPVLLPSGGLCTWHAPEIPTAARPTQ